MSISAEDRAKLVDLARSAAKAAVTGDAPPQPGESAGIFGERRGCFVTLKNSGRLRGCIGTFTPEKPLGWMIVEMAVAASTQDPRFLADPITPAELGELTVEVSVLSPLEETDDPEVLEIGRHGIYIVGGGRSGCFLPEVATDQGWNTEQFLDHCCTGKAHLAAGAWRQSDTKVYLFTSEKFEQ